VRDGDMQSPVAKPRGTCPAPRVDWTVLFDSLQVTLLDYSSYVGAIGIGRINGVTIEARMTVTFVLLEGKSAPEKISSDFGFSRPDSRRGGIRRRRRHRPFGGISNRMFRTPCATRLTGKNRCPVSPWMSRTIMHDLRSIPRRCLGPRRKIRHHRQIREAWNARQVQNVACASMPDRADPDKFRGLRRGELHLGVLLENMRREL